MEKIGVDDMPSVPIAMDQEPEAEGRGSSIIEELWLPFDLRFGYPGELVDTIKDYSSKLATRIDAIHDAIRKKLKLETDRLKTCMIPKPITGGTKHEMKYCCIIQRRRKEDRPNLRSHKKALIMLLRRSTT
ncbi:hypothetical protein NQ317_006810 [Molorchus minor]|uniref:Uncharacterized protein n=1 Tax=Molorchus minor TaxID=1323400 RepID=A0ABQ9JFK7_9CUCU|nr:hypothetical protein NQ317_006810 [Molorchus minor]